MIDFDVENPIISDDEEVKTRKKKKKKPKKKGDGKKISVKALNEKERLLRDTALT